jgi:predicted ArsR family transcriptional regulator
MYLFARGEGRAVTRDEVAAATGVSRKLAAFHLDKLVDRGLLVASYARPPGRSGRGAGRSAKYYAPSDRELDVSIPERNYDVIGSILLGAIERQRPGESAEDAAHRVAHETGEGIGDAERARRRLPPPGAERAMTVTSEVLSACGYEPYVHEGAVRLRSCPFHALAEQHRDIVCSLNRDLIEGVVKGLGNDTLDVELRPTPGECCVRLRPPGRS